MNVATEIGLPSRIPRQGRSKASFERMLAAAEALMAERGFDDFTLSEVSKAGKVSIGSIYCRFDSKDDLVRAVQQRAQDRIETDQTGLIAKARASSAHLDELNAALVNGIAESLRRHAAILRPMMMRAGTDPIIADTGKRSYQVISGRVADAMLAYREEIRHPDPDRAVHSAFRIFYATLARYLGFGSAAIAAGEGDWILLKQDVADMMSAFLMTAPRR